MASKKRRLTTAEARKAGRPIFHTPYPLSDVRCGVGITQEQLSRDSGISRAAIANFERKRRSMSALDGIEIFTAIARAVSRSPEHTSQAKQNALSLIAQQKQDDLARIDNLRYQIEQLEKKIAELDSKEARLNSQGQKENER
jgi:transcriptional regulator with XRE-family HTH domain